MPTIDSKQLAALLRTAAASDEPVTEVAVPGGGFLRYRKRVSPSVGAQIETVSADGLSTVFQRVFRAASSRPSDYPATAPFLADHEANVTDSPDGLVLAWSQVSDLDVAFDRVVEGSMSGGR